MLMADAYAKYISEHGETQFEQFVAEGIKCSPHFQFWHITLELILLILSFVRSIREGNFDLYIESLSNIASWMFAMDHTNYSRCLPVHIRDMMTLKHVHPNVFVQFCAGNFVIRKTKCKFSAMGTDQAHEQNNALVKGNGGAVGITENRSALLRWMLAGPEVAHLVQEFDHQIHIGQEDGLLHHEQIRSCQTVFLQEVKSLYQVINSYGNPFLERSNDLLVLDTRDIVDFSATRAVREIENLGRMQYETFVHQRLETGSVSIYEPIKRNSLAIFKHLKNSLHHKRDSKIASLRSDVSLFSSLYIACQVRESNMTSFFEHENQAFPPSLAHNGQMRTGTKSELIECLLEQINIPITQQHPQVDAVALDGGAIIHMLSPGLAKTFKQYTSEVFMPFLQQKLEYVKRLDLVFDQYFNNSLKTATRKSRGHGTRRRVSAENHLPTNWQSFLHVDANKTELFTYLAKEIHLMPVKENKQIIVTQGSGVLSTPENLYAGRSR